MIINEKLLSYNPTEPLELDETAGLQIDTFDVPSAMGVEINGKRYVYKPKGSINLLTLKDTFNKMRKYSDGKALAWLKKNAVTI